MQKRAASAVEEADSTFLWGAPLPRSYLEFFGQRLVRFLVAVHGLGAFTLITLGVLFSKFGVARTVMRPLILGHLARAGLRLLPMILFLATALGLVVIGQTVSLLSRVGANNFLGVVMVTVVVRELGALLAALFVLTRSGAANVIELGTARALGEVEALEVLGIDPIHYLVMPRVLGTALGIFSLTVYFILVALVSGYFWAFLQNVPLTPGDYFGQLAAALNGLATLLRLADFSCVTVRDIAHSFVV